MTQLEKERAASTPGKVVYTARTHTTVPSRTRSVLQFRWLTPMSTFTPDHRAPVPIPEQFSFAAGWSACFESAINLGGPQEEDRFVR